MTDSDRAVLVHNLLQDLQSTLGIAINRLQVALLDQNRNQLQSVVSAEQIGRGRAQHVMSTSDVSSVSITVLPSQNSGDASASTVTSLLASGLGPGGALQRSSALGTINLAASCVSSAVSASQWNHGRDVRRFFGVDQRRFVYPRAGHRRRS